MHEGGVLGTIILLNVSIQQSSTEFTKSPLNNSDLIDNICSSIIEKMGLSVLSTSKHNFTPYGITQLYLLSESHLSIHTWPEHNAFAMDVHSCNNITDNDADTIITILKEHLPIQNINFKLIERNID